MTVERTVAGLTRRRLMGNAGALAIGLAAPSLIAGRARAEEYDGTPFDAGGESIRLAMWGGTFEAALREHVIPEVEATFNARVEYDSAFPFFPRLVAAGPDNPPYDLVNMNVTDLKKVTLSGNFFVPLDDMRGNVPNAVDLWDFGSFSNVGLTWIFTELGYAYRTDALAGEAAPDGFASFWEPRFENARAGFITTNNFFVNHFLLTCAVHGSGPTDLEAGYDAYRRLGSMKIANFSSAMTQLIGQGEAGIGIHHDAETYAAIAGGQPMGFARWTGYTPIVDQTLAVCRGSSPMRRRLAYAFADRLVGAPFQEVMANRLFTQGTNRNMRVPEALAALGVENTPEAAAGRWVAPWDFWLENEIDVVETVNQIYAS
ncbi:MAG: hypothetical protein JJU19_12110 [Pararhodobacter sp.]|nr:hypothetical protein [Pararhodobacter sp.]